MVAFGLQSLYDAALSASRTTLIGNSSRRHGQRPSISSTSVQLKKVRTRTSPARRPRLVKVSSIAMVFMISAATSFEAKEQRSSDADFVVIVTPLLCTSIYIEAHRPDDAGNDYEDSENFDASTNKGNPVACGPFETEQAFDIHLSRSITAERVHHLFCI
jgi:hypothetical protein